MKRMKLATLGSTKMKALQPIAVILVMLGTGPVFAQAAPANVTTTMTNIQTLLTGVAVTLFTISILWAGFKMAFQHAKWSEISNIVIGGILVGGAAGFAAWLV